MGANQSSSETRNVSLDNPNPTGVIDVSEEVVERLKLGLSRANAAKNKQKQEPKDEPRLVPSSPPPPPPPSSTPPPPKPAPALPKTYYSNPTPPPPSSQQQQLPYARFPNEPTITSIEMRRQKEIELQQNDQIWRTRMAQLEQTLSKTNGIMEKEYSAAVEDVRKRFMNASPTRQLPPCQDLKAQLIACYRAYPGETLKCAEEVALFRNCVGVHRIKRLDIEEVTAKGA